MQVQNEVLLLYRSLYRFIKNQTKPNQKSPIKKICGKSSLTESVHTLRQNFGSDSWSQKIVGESEAEVILARNRIQYMIFF